MKILDIESDIFDNNWTPITIIKFSMEFDMDVKRRSEEC